MYQAGSSDALPSLVSYQFQLWFCGSDKHREQKQPGEEGVDFYLTGYRASLRESQEIQGRSLKQSMEELCLEVCALVSAQQVFLHS